MLCVLTAPAGEMETSTVERGGEMEAGFAYEALEWQYRLRSHPVGSIPERWMETALGQMASLKSPGDRLAPSALTWLPVGPDNCTRPSSTRYRVSPSAPR